MQVVLNQQRWVTSKHGLRYERELMGYKGSTRSGADRALVSVVWS